MVMLPRTSPFCRSFKITPRSQNAHAYVNAALRGKVKREAGGVSFVGKPSLVFGGISDSFVHASRTEEYLKDKKISDEAVFKGALAALDQEVSPTEAAIYASKEYRKHLTKALFYKVR